MSKTIFFFVKIFDEKKYAMDFIKGKLFSNRLSYFRNLEESQGANRGDKNEGVVSLFQPDKVNIVINDRVISDLSGPISIKMNWHDNLNVFCIYAAHSGSFDSLTEKNFNAFKKQLEIPEDCLNLGKYAVVVTSVSQFIERVQSAVEKYDYGLHGDLVEYYDPNSFNGTFDQNEAIFKKRNEYKHQKEYRFAFDRGVVGEDPLTLDIGDISDITMLCDVTDVNVKLEMSLPSSESA
jgi:hypothetical protein